MREGTNTESVGRESRHKGPDANVPTPNCRFRCRLKAAELPVSLAYRTTSAPVGITSKNPAMHRPACTKLAKPPLLAPVMIPSAGVVDLEGVSLSDGLVFSSSPASEEGGTGAGASSDSTAVRVKLSVVLPNAW